MGTWAQHGNTTKEILYAKTQMHCGYRLCIKALLETVKKTDVVSGAKYGGITNECMHTIHAQTLLLFENC
jgi:hypothetical protein